MNQYKSSSSILKYCNIITDEIMMDAIGIPQPINQVLFFGVVWFMLYVTTKTTYVVLNICYGGKSTSV